jgi:hypothetical protein
MTVKTTLIALSAAVVLGALGTASTAQAGGNSGEYTGGYRIGPLGQVFGSRRGTAFGFYVPRWHRYYARHRMWHYEY